VLWQRFLLDLCTKQVVSARACVNQFLPYSSSGIALFGMRNVQADSCLNSEQIDTLFISVGGQEGGLGGGYYGPEAQKLHVTVMNFLLGLLPTTGYIVQNWSSATFCATHEPKSILKHSHSKPQLTPLVFFYLCVKTIQSNTIECIQFEVM